MKQGIYLFYQLIRENTVKQWLNGGKKMDIGKQIKTLRLAKEVKQEELAEYPQVPPGGI